jgi:carboxypeptidase Q
MSPEATVRPRIRALGTIALLLTSFISTSAAQRPGTAKPEPAASTVAVDPKPDRVDLDAVYRIKDEGLQRSQVMDTAWYLTEAYGARLTNSPGMNAAADWAIKRMGDWGLSGVRKEVWGPFGRGWANEKLTLNELTPTPAPLLAYARAWTPGTNGTVAADAMLVVIERDEDFKRWEGKLTGKVVLTQNPPEVRALFTPLGRRLTAQELSDLEVQPVTPPRGGGPAPAGPPAPAVGTPPQTQQPPLAVRRMRFFASQGVVAVLEPGTGRSDHGAVPVQGSNANRDAKEPPVAPQIVVATEQYNRLARLLARNHPVRLELNVQNRFFDQTLDSYNLVAELPGTDRADEVVMLGAHFDSWHAGTGATDNAAGSAAMMEAMRILKATGLRMRRTVRLALWTGEEQGLLGSAAYVRQQFADRDSMALKPGHAKLSVYFNMDNGTGAIRGVYLQGNEAIRPVFSTWMEPFRSLGMTTLSIRGTGSTDHVPFNDVGLPGFQFVQDPVEYSTHSHHTNMDVYDRLQAEDLMKNAVIIASFAYHAANRDTLLPRKPLPAPRSPRPNATQ